MRRRLVICCVVAAGALAVAATALAGNGGIAPPTPESPNAARIADAYWVIMGATGAVFLLVEVSLIVFIVRFRSRGRARTVEGPQIRGNTRLEIIWTAVPVVVLVAIAGFVLYKLPGIQNVPSANAQDDPTVQIRAHQFYWEFRYPNGAVSIDTLYAPLGRVVRLDITSGDVDHSWWIPQLNGKFDAIPGRTNKTWFRAEKAGTYVGQCGEFCGIFHAAMTARVRVLPPNEYEAWVRTRATSPSGLGRDIWRGACAKCHGVAGAGDYGPTLKSSPILADRRALETIVRNGRNRMPPVGDGWTKAEMDALFEYTQAHVAKGGGGGG